MLISVKIVTKGLVTCQNLNINTVISVIMLTFLTTAVLNALSNTVKWISRNKLAFTNETLNSFIQNVDIIFYINVLHYILGR